MRVDDDQDYDSEKDKKSDEGDNEGCKLMMIRTMIVRKVKGQMRLIMRTTC